MKNLHCFTNKQHFVDKFPLKAVEGPTKYAQSKPNPPADAGTDAGSQKADAQSESHPLPAFKKFMRDQEKARLRREFEGLKGRVEAGLRSDDEVVKGAAVKVKAQLDDLDGKFNLEDKEKNKDNLPMQDIIATLNAINTELDKVPHYLHQSIRIVSERAKNFVSDAVVATRCGDIARCYEDLMKQYGQNLSPETMIALKKSMEVAQAGVKSAAQLYNSEIDMVVNRSKTYGDDVSRLQGSVKDLNRLVYILVHKTDADLSEFVGKYNADAYARTVFETAGRPNPEQYIESAVWRAKKSLTVKVETQRETDIFGKVVAIQKEDTVPQSDKDKVTKLTNLSKTSTAELYKVPEGRNRQEGVARVLAKFQDKLNAIMGNQDDDLEDMMGYTVVKKKSPLHRPLVRDSLVKIVGPTPEEKTAAKAKKSKKPNRAGGTPV